MNIWGYKKVQYGYLGKNCLVSNHTELNYFEINSNTLILIYISIFSGCLESHWFSMDSRSRITFNEFELVVDEKLCLERKYWEFTYSTIKSDQIIDQNMWTSTVYKKFLTRWFGIDPIFDKFDDFVGHEHDFRIITIGNSWHHNFKTRILDWKIGFTINQVQGVSLQIVHFIWIGHAQDIHFRTKFHKKTGQ